MKPQTVLRGVGVAAIVSLAWPAVAMAQRLTPLPHAMPGGARAAATAQPSAADCRTRAAARQAQGLARRRQTYLWRCREAARRCASPGKPRCL